MTCVDCSSIQTLVPERIHGIVVNYSMPFNCLFGVLDCNNRLNNIIFLSLYSGDVNEALCWDLRVNIALDVARGLEYLHDGVSFHVI